MKITELYNLDRSALALSEVRADKLRITRFARKRVNVRLVTDAR